MPLLRYACAHGGSALHIRTCSYAVCAGVVLVTGCAEWPRFDHLPDEAGSHAIDTPPGALVSVEWVDLDEPVPDPGDHPDGDALPLALLGPGGGVRVQGTLEGLGWSDVSRPRRIWNLDCADSEGYRSPLGSGDYLGDVDPLLVEVTAEGTLCAAVEFDRSDIGWDLVVFPLDACSIPGAPLEGADGGILGFGLGGARGGFGEVVKAGRYAVQLAAYDPYEPETALSYLLGVSVVPKAADGRPSLCPLLSSEAP